MGKRGEMGRKKSANKVELTRDQKRGEDDTRTRIAKGGGEVWCLQDLRETGSEMVTHLVVGLLRGCEHLLFP